MRASKVSPPMIFGRPHSPYARTVKRARSPAASSARPAASIVQLGAWAMPGSISRLKGDPRTGALLHVIASWYEPLSVAR